VLSTQHEIEDAAPGSGAMVALRAIGMLFAARWLQAMSETGFSEVLRDIGSSPIAILHLLYIFLLIALPGARPGPAHPYQPLPAWLRQSLRGLSLLCLALAVASIVAFTLRAGLPALVEAVKTSNGWLVMAPALYLLASWLCRRRALWRTRATANRFAIGSIGIALDPEARTVVVWDQNRQIGQYLASELGLQQARSGLFTRIELIWTSLAAAGHNRKRVFRVRSFSARDRASALALDTALKRL
jgi:hypothetical protein